MDSILLRKTVIDIGTNTILMLIADFRDGRITPVLDVQRIPRLGKGVDSSGMISSESIKKAIDILCEYKAKSQEHLSTSVVAVATSFLRDALNKNEFIEEVKKHTGVEVELLSGDDESKWSFIGGVYDKLHGNRKVTLIDIGGGSTEITTANISSTNLNELVKVKNSGISLNIGSVRLKEKFFHDTIYNENSILQSRDFIRSEFNKVKLDLNNSVLIGVAGTITTLAAIKMKLDKFDPYVIDGTFMNKKEVTELIELLSEKEKTRLLSDKDYMKGRSDIILTGSLILHEFMNYFGFTNITVSTKGLRYGIMIREFVSVITATAQNISE